MVIQLMPKGMYRATMGTKVGPNSVVEKSKFFNKLDEAFGMIRGNLGSKLGPVRKGGNNKLF